jgi:HD-like signal output (HDOD) protein
MQEQQSAVLSKLLSSMANDPGFAGLGGSVQVISRMGDDDSDARDITTAILRDAALTSKLLRLANASSRSTRNVATIDQALTVLGLNTVKSVALSLALLDSLSNKPQSTQLHAEIVAAYVCGTIAAKVTRNNGVRFKAQEAQVCGLMQNLGRMMATYYLYDDIERSRALQAEENLAEDEAVMRTLGVRFEEIGAVIAQNWNLPDIIQNSLAPHADTAPTSPSANAMNWHQQCALFSRRITDALFRLPANREKAELAQTLSSFRAALSLHEDETLAWIEQALGDTEAVLQDMGFPVNLNDARALLRKGSEVALDILSSQDSLAQARSDDVKKPIEVIHQALRKMHAEYAFDLTMLLLPNGGSGLVAVAGVGRDASQIASKFRCHGPRPDIFRLLMAKQADMFMADVRAPAYAKLMPPWYQELVGASSFLALSLVHDGKFLGMVYGDYLAPVASAPKGKTEDALKIYRAQLIGALRIAG